ncbi:thermosome subunit [Candidatus Pacearchaeota archaeon CG_4_9_14_3_um_filter_31_7]|nr:MAG: thermosome subunit [Candidatus Pacearchaeota archaeon CG1_02_31_27]PIN91834.1 MAG: thermosome subunit [Candidatus Pacearchaeota archaeon CG10_big_fil_rev_8_21_14_0_10_31_59]PIZ80539.1 MAG: thermosome subunit [Candidatus Pacearchaeota archaeon CG_4_10_14_0_2_um_filter_31_10]PJA70583.1 MAG: thermosome subunit [Candidatus Pacearchaeota archaeon CG_4_9_14_3_um_filter_31_7]
MADKQPVYILPENVQRMMGRDAQRNNILAARIVAETVKSTLGPKGMDKMLVDSTGDVVITNDGVTILQEMEIEHPAAKMVVEVAKTQDQEVGDGTTTAVILAGKLLENAEQLLDQKIHSTIIVKGYRLAEKKAQEVLNQLSHMVDPSNEELLKNIAMTSMTGKGAEVAKEYLTNLIIKAVKQIMKISEGKYEINFDDIKLEKMKGKGVEDSELLQGIVIDKERVNQDMPQKITNARIALIDSPLEIKGPETDTKISISSPDQLQSFLEQEEKILKEMVEKVKNSKANAVFCQKGIDDVAQYYLSKEGIYAVRRVKKDDLERLSRATGARIISNLKELDENVLGKSALVEEKKEGDEIFTYITGCENPKAVTIIIRGGTEHVVDETQRAIKDGIGVIVASIKDGRVVAGGGSFEIELSRRLREYAKNFSGREQLAIEKFADALESIPITLAENAGLDPIDILTELKSRHEAGENEVGLNLLVGKIEDTFEAGVVEPLKIKTQALKSATEVATMILRIDDVIASGKGASPNMPPMQGYE